MMVECTMGKSFSLGDERSWSEETLKIGRVLLWAFSGLAPAPPRSAWISFGLVVPRPPTTPFESASAALWLWLWLCLWLLLPEATTKLPLHGQNGPRQKEGTGHSTCSRDGLVSRWKRFD